MSDASYQPLIYKKQGGAEMVFKAGAVLTLEGTAAIKSADGSEIVSTKRYQSIDIADLSADATYYLTALYAGKITKIDTITDGAVGTADAVVTPSINGVAVTDGAVTIATSSSAAGDQDSAVPTAANTVAAGDKISLAVTGGGAGGSPRGHVSIEITAQ